MALSAAAPVLLIIALLVKLDSPGPVLYLQRRVGRFERPFRIVKFRTMRLGADVRGPLVTSASDPRVTRIGHWLRKLKLDELPQLVNVISGDMSLVGPRPEVEKYIEHWPQDLRPVILSVRPGITDPASLEYFDEAGLLAQSPDTERAYIEHVLPRKVLIYQQYVQNRSFQGDLAILLRTTWRVTGARFWVRKP